MTSSPLNEARIAFETPPQTWLLPQERRQRTFVMVQPEKRSVEAVPRHAEIANKLAKKICKGPIYSRNWLMRHWIIASMLVFARSLCVFVFALAWFAVNVDAENKCSAKGVMAGLDFSINHCAVAFYESDNSVTLWFSGSPISAEELEKFQWNSYADVFKKDSAGKPRTMITLGFCPGGGKPTADPAAVKTIEIAFNHASTNSLGPQDQWVLELPKDKELKLEKLSGDLKPGGNLSGRITGALSSAGKPFKWEIDFQMTLPEKAAAAGPGCGS